MPSTVFFFSFSSTLFSFPLGYIEQVVLSPKSPIVKHVPTLPVIVYSIQNILRPRLATRRIPELLDLLATVEFYRGRTLDQARDALTWNDYYTVNPPTVLLTDQETASLKHIESEMAALRLIYVTILTTCCHLVSTHLSHSITTSCNHLSGHVPSMDRRSSIHD